jgi:transcriptional regulator with XRE-family HTH domain
MNGFIKKSVPTLTLGEKLQKLRGERRMSLSEVSRLTKIQVKYLEYLESGAYENLPVDVYVKGFLKNYAEVLGVDENILIRLYDKEKGIRKNLEKSKGLTGDVLRFGRLANHEDRPRAVNVSSFVITPKVIGLALVALLILGGIFYLYAEVGSFANTPRLVILGPEKNHTTSENSVLVEGVTDRDARIFINDQPLLVSDEGKFREAVTVQDGTNVINVKAVNRFDKEISETLTINADLPEENMGEAPMGEEENNIGETKGLAVEIRVDPGPVWLSVETDGNLVFSGTMLSGETQNFQAESKIMINSGRGEATFVKFNNKDIGAIGRDAGAVRGFTLSPDSKF